MTHSLEAARVTLRRVFGFDDFRPGQDEVIGAVLAGEDVLAVMPTGGGKSLCYQLPALLLPGLVVVVSPLIALMRDQVGQLRQLGIDAGALNSANEPAENLRVHALLASGALRLLYLAPERLAQAETAERLAASGVALLAIDEAHCVSQWGHDFRPEYLQLGGLRAAIGARQAIALTATADLATRKDIARRLFPAPPRVVVQGFDRPNLHLAMAPKAGAGRQIARFVAAHRGQSGIVYCATRKGAEAVAQTLAADRYRALPYHAGLDKTVREANQDVFLKEDGVVIAATVAFGMGIDKPDVRFVAHADLPKTIESYYQEIGRAGRDGLPADTLTLYGLDDMRLRRRQIDESDASEEVKFIERQRFNALVALCEAPRCRRQTLLAYFGEETGPCGNCDLCGEGVETFDATVLAQKAMSAIARTGQRFGTEHLVNILVGNGTDPVRRLGHHRLPTFGVGKEDCDVAGWRSLYRQLFAAGLITMEIGGFATWSLTERGRAVLRGAERVSLRRLEAKPARGRGPRRAAAPGPDIPTDGEGAALLERLKRLRTRLARERNVPAYVVFADRTLIDMAARRPASLAEMRAVHGVGEAKLEAYGRDFLAVVQGETPAEQS